MKGRRSESTLGAEITLAEPSNSSGGSPFYGRVLRLDGTTLTLSTSEGVHSESLKMPPNVAIDAGDLVRICAPGRLELIRKNDSAVPLEQQDWWRLHRILPNLKTRHRLLREIRTYFDAQHFLEIEAPQLIPYPSQEVHLSSIEASAGGEKRYLATSPEPHMKRLLSSGIEKIYSLGKAFRDEEQGSHHLNEFTLLEWYRVDAGVDQLMSDVSALVQLATGGKERSWTRLSVAEALKRWGTPTQDPEDVIRQLVEHVEPQLAKLGCVFLTDYPAELASLARLRPEDPTISERFEAYVDGIELANGFGELTCPVEQRARFESDQHARAQTGRPVYPLDEPFLQALHAGMPPAAGIALGIDRLVMIATQSSSIEEVVAFTTERA